MSMTNTQNIIYTCQECDVTYYRPQDDTQPSSCLVCRDGDLALTQPDVHLSSIEIALVSSAGQEYFTTQTSAGNWEITDTQHLRNATKLIFSDIDLNSRTHFEKMRVTCTEGRVDHWETDAELETALNVSPIHRSVTINSQSLSIPLRQLIDD